MESSSGQMEDHIKEIGSKESSMERACMLHLKALRSMESGRMERGIDGFAEMRVLDENG